MNPPRRRHRFWAALLLAPVLAVAQSGKEKQQLEALRSRIEALRTKIAEGEENRTEARDQLRDSERAISEANRALRALVAKRAAAQSELKTLARRSRSVESEIATRQESLGRLLGLRHLEGEINQVKLLLSGEDPGSIARDLHYYAYISQAQAQMIGELRARLASLKELESLAREKSAELAAIESAQRRERSALLARQAERRRVFERVSKELRAQRLEVTQLQRDESRMARLVEELGRVIASTPLVRNEVVPESAGAGVASEGLKRGLRLPVKGELVERFGAKRPGGGPASKGVFIRSPSGQEVRAVAAGRVVFSDWLRGFGNLLIIDHGRSYLTIYGYNEALLKDVGDVVRAGDVIATVGASGGTRESGLYFEIRHGGRAFDPMGWVSLR